MGAIFWLLNTVIDIYTWVLIAAVVASWLIAFNTINIHNPTVRQIMGFLEAATEPVLRPIRSVIPAIGGLDISPIIALIALHFLQRLLYDLYVSLL